MMRCLHFVVDTQRYFLANSGSFEIREFHDLQTHPNCTRNLAGSLHRISVMRSNRSESESVRVPQRELAVSWQPYPPLVTDLRKWRRVLVIRDAGRRVLGFVKIEERDQ